MYETYDHSDDSNVTLTNFLTGETIVVETTPDHDHLHDEEGVFALNSSTSEPSNQIWEDHDHPSMPVQPGADNEFSITPGGVIIADGETTNGNYSLIDLSLPTQVGPPPHIHTQEDEAFFVLQGEVEILLGDQTFTGTPGSFVYLPKNTLHAFKTVGSTPVRMLNILNPPGAEEFFQQLGPIGTPEYYETLPQGANFGIQFPDSLVFAGSEYSVNEDGTAIAEVTLLRPGTLEGKAGATITLSDGTANNGQDYLETEISVKFAEGETSKTVAIPIVDDQLLEGDETINLALTNPTEGAIIGLLQDTAVLTIVDNDAPPNQEEVIANHSHDTLTGMDHDHDLITEEDLLLAENNYMATSGNSSSSDLLVLPPQNPIHTHDFTDDFSVGNSTLTAGTGDHVYDYDHDHQLEIFHPVEANTLADSDVTFV